jgi:hypothetical protein
VAREDEEVEEVTAITIKGLNEHEIPLHILLSIPTEPKNAVIRYSRSYLGITIHGQTSHQTKITLQHPPTPRKTHATTTDLHSHLIKQPLPSPFFQIHRQHPESSTSRQTPRPRIKNLPSNKHPAPPRQSSSDSLSPHPTSTSHSPLTYFPRPHSHRYADTAHTPNSDRYPPASRRRPASRTSR